MKALEEVFASKMPKSMGYDYLGMSYQEKARTTRRIPSVIFGLSLLFVFLILAAQYESWALPISVLICTPIAVFGAFVTLARKTAGKQRLRADRISDVNRVGGKECHFDC